MDYRTLELSIHNRLKHAAKIRRDGDAEETHVIAGCDGLVSETYSSNSLPTREAEKQIKRHGPRTEPCGTKQTIMTSDGLTVVSVLPWEGPRRQAHCQFLTTLF